MPDIVKKYLDKIKEFWNKYNKKQKTIFISSVLVAVIAIAILGFVLAQPQTVVVRYCSTASEATEVRQLLTSNDIPCTVGSNFEIIIDKKDEIEAQLVLGSNNIASTGYSYADVLTGSFSQTQDDKEKLYVETLEKKFAAQLAKIDGIKSAQVTIRFEDNSSIFEENKDAHITATLVTSKTLSESTTEAIGLMLANNVGSNNTNNVVVIDDKGQLLFSGIADASGNSSGLKTSTKFQREMMTNMEARVKKLALAMQNYSDAEVMANLVFDSDKVTEITQKYNIPDGSEEGLRSTSYEVNSTNGTGSGGTAGTESNDDDTGYDIENGTTTNGEYNLTQIDWLQNSTYTTKEKAAEAIVYSDSSLSIILTKYNVVSEDDLRTQGLLGDMTYDEYKLANSSPTPITVEEDLAQLIAFGTGIDVNNIAISANMKYVFLDTPKSSTPTSFIIQIVLAVLIVGLLLFVVFRSARPVTVEETEPELSVEDMLASTREKQAPLEEIDLQDKSEARKAIEKFVQENPEAVAMLLRNWLNDGWD